MGVECSRTIEFFMVDQISKRVKYKIVIIFPAIFPFFIARLFNRETLSVHKPWSIYNTNTFNLIDAMPFTYFIGVIAKCEECFYLLACSFKHMALPKAFENIVIICVGNRACACCTTTPITQGMAAVILMTWKPREYLLACYHPQLFLSFFPVCLFPWLL